MTTLFRADKNLYKANLHCHTTVSDGKLSPEAIKALYKANGYAIVAFSDHNKLVPHSALDGDGFLAINALEVDLNAKRSKATYHFNLLATRRDMTETPPLPDMPYTDGEAINRYIADRTAEGFLVVYNHPYWSLQTFADFHWLHGLFGVEIYNHSCEVETFCGHTSQVYDEMLREGEPEGKGIQLHCLATDDNHNRGDDDAIGGFVMVNAASLTYEDVMAALAAGDFYASQGPQMHEITLEETPDGKTLRVRCSPSAEIVVFTHERRCHAKRNASEAAFVLTGDERYVRVMCRDAAGKCAWSNAYFL